MSPELGGDPGHHIPAPARGPPHTWSPAKSKPPRISNRPAARTKPPAVSTKDIELSTTVGAGCPGPRVRQQLRPVSANPSQGGPRRRLRLPPLTNSSAPVLAVLGYEP
nr:Hypothetical protein [Aeromonas caviae]